LDELYGENENLEGNEESNFENDNLEGDEDLDKALNKYEENGNFVEEEEEEEESESNYYF
jgi:hypothetical protein